MNETSKMPFEPISIPGIPEMPALPEMPRPSFSRTSTPPAPPPMMRRPLIIEDEKPNPFLLPPGIAPEAVVPVAPPPPAESGSMLSWLKPSRAKGVVLAGLGSLGIGAFGLNAFIPIDGKEPAKVNSLVETTPTAAKAGPIPRVIEEHQPVETPGLLPATVVLEKNEEPLKLHVPPAIALVGDTTPTPLPVVPIGVPAIPAALPGLPVVPPVTIIDPLPVPSLTGTTLPAPAIPGFEENPTIKVIPLTPETPPKAGALPKIDTVPAPAPIPVTPDPVLAPAPGLLPSITPSPLPVAAPGPLPLPESKPGSKELRPFPEIKSDPKPLPVEAKTDYDDDIHKLRAGDTYAAISQKFYGSASYAGALRGYNDNSELTGLRDVQVPPMHIIKKFSGTGAMIDTPKVIPAGVLQDPGLVPPPPIENSVEWGSPGTRKTDKPPAVSGGVTWR